MESNELTWNLHLVQNPILKFMHSKHTLSFQHPLVNQPKKMKNRSKLYKKLTKVVCVGDLFPPESLDKEVLAFKKKYQYVEITIKGLMEAPESIVPNGVE